MVKPLNIKQERFAQLVVSGMPATRAYREAGYNVTEKVAGTCGPRMVENARVKARINELRKKLGERIEFKREDLVRHLVSAVTTPVNEIDGSSPLSQEVSTFSVTIATGKNKRTETRTRVKSQGKLESALLLTDIMGWKEPEQLVVETGPKTLASIEARAATVASASALDRARWQ